MGRRKLQKLQNNSGSNGLICHITHITLIRRAGLDEAQDWYEDILNMEYFLNQFLPKIFFLTLQCPKLTKNTTISSKNISMLAPKGARVR